jgi:magnesium transporter
MGFLVICSGVVLLQLAKSSKDVPDSAVFKGDLDQVRTVAEQEEPEYEPRADTIRGGAGIVRAMSRVRTKRQADEVRRIHDERMAPVGENEEYEWDGLRRRRTMSTAHSTSVKRTKSVHPPLGMSHFPDEDNVSEPDSEVHPGFFGRIGRRSRTTTLESQQTRRDKGHSPVALREVYPDTGLSRGASDPDTEYKGAASTHIHFAGDVHDARDRASSHTSSLAPPKPPPHASKTGGANTRRQFSFQNVFHRKHSDAADDNRPTSRGALSFISRGGSSAGSHGQHSYPSAKGETEEERLGLVHGDSSNKLPKYAEVVSEEPSAEQERDSDEWQVTSGTESSPHDVEMDLGRQRRARDPYDDYYDDSDELYDEPIRSPTKDYEYHGRGGRGGAGGSTGAFV